MQSYRLRLRPLSAFGSPLKGDTLFGQLCWAIRNRRGEARLEELLDGYTNGSPFAMISDAFPAGYLPRPTLPSTYFDPPADQDRKALKRLKWIPIEGFDEPLRQWLQRARTDSQLARPESRSRFQQMSVQPHNSINRLTGTTGAGLAPYGMQQIWYQPGTELDVYLVLDESRVQTVEIRTAMEDIGAFGFGRDASIGLGKLECLDWQQTDFPAQPNANAGLALAPIAPQGLGFDPQRSFYTVFTRFGRHGDIGVHGANPFKSPVLLADTGAVLSPAPTPESYVGQGLGGNGELSKSIQTTVHQGYAPALAVRLPEIEENPS